MRCVADNRKTAETLWFQRFSVRTLLSTGGDKRDRTADLLNAILSPMCFPRKTGRNRAALRGFLTPLRGGKIFDSTQIPLFSKGKSTLQNCLFSVRRLVGKPLQRFGLRRRHRRLWAESPVIFQAAAQAVRFPSSGRDRNGKPGYFTCPAQGQKLGASPREKQVFPVISRQTVYRKTPAKFEAFPVKNFAAIPVAQCRPVQAACLAGCISQRNRL